MKNRKSNLSVDAHAPMPLRLIKYMAKNRVRFVFIIILTVISSLARVMGMAALEPIINNHLLPFVGQPSPDLSGLVFSISALVIMYVIGASAMYLQKWLVMHMANDTLFDIREDLISKTLSLPVKYFDDRTHGDVMSTFTNDVEVIRIVLQQSFTELIGAILMLVGLSIAMLRSNIPLAFLAGIMFVVMFFVVRKMGSISGNNFRKQQILIGDANGYIEEMVEGQSVVKVFNREKNVVDDFDVIVTELEKVGVIANTYANYIMPITFNISYFHYVFTAVLGGYMTIFGTLNVGILIAFMQFTRMLGTPITQVSQQFNAILMGLAGAERIFSVMDSTPEIDEGTISFVSAKYNEKNDLVESIEETGMYAWKYHDGFNQTNYRPVQGDIIFKDVHFSYDGKRKVLKEINLRAKPGQKVALVGSTGAGKTTITNLLTRFYEIDDGDILYDNFNIKNIEKNALRRSLSMVLQDTNLFTDTIMENIRYGRLNATDEEVMEAAKLANAHEFIMDQNDGYQTILADSGGNLSQGQRQLLSIARASVADPITLILDEATSSIDTRTERLIQKGMDTLMEGRTTFVIAHRLSTIQNSDIIMVLEDGEIIENGDHETLMAKKGRYYQLYTGMFELT